MRVVILRGVLVSSLALIAIVISLTVILLTLLVAFVVSRIQRGLTKFSRAAEIAVAVPVATAPSRNIVTVGIAIVTGAIALAITVGVVSVVECFAKISTVE